MAANPALRWLRENPHRFNLGRLGLRLRGEHGAPARFDEISRPYQTLHMWRGHLRSQFSYGDGGGQRGDAGASRPDHGVGGNLFADGENAPHRA